MNGSLFFPVLLSDAATMVVRIRLARFGRHNWPTYRIVAADARAPRDGRFLEHLGAYDPHPNKGAQSH